MEKQRLQRSYLRTPCEETQRPRMHISTPFFRKGLERPRTMNPTALWRTINRHLLGFRNNQPTVLEPLTPGYIQYTAVRTLLARFFDPRFFILALIVLSLRGMRRAHIHTLSC